MMYDELPFAQKVEIIRACAKHGIFHPDDIRTAYNRYVEGKDIFGEGGILLPDGGWLDKAKQAYHNFLQGIGVEEKPKPVSPTYRGKPAVISNGKAYPQRIMNNDSPTQKESEQWENRMRVKVVEQQGKANGSNPAFDIPFIPEKKILINGSTTSTNVLDSLAKYAGIHNRKPVLSEHSIMRSSKYSQPRQINMNEMLGLSTQETRNGAWPYFNMNGDREHDRSLGNSNYFTAFGYIPADNIVRNFHYNDANVSRETPPLLEAFRYFAQGDYNRGDKNHTADVNAAGKKAWENPQVKDWWELSGKYWYRNGQGPKK